MIGADIICEPSLDPGLRFVIAWMAAIRTGDLIALVVALPVVFAFFGVVGGSLYGAVWLGWQVAHMTWRGVRAFALRVVS